MATGVSDNGIVIGASISTFSWASHPFIWSAKTGLQRLQPLLVKNGAVIPKGVTLTNVLALPRTAQPSWVCGWIKTSIRVHGSCG